MLSKKPKQYTSHVQPKAWDSDDMYLVVSEFQVMERDGFKAGDLVKVTVEKWDGVEEDADEQS